jgi:hypothetical protein
MKTAYTDRHKLRDARIILDFRRGYPVTVNTETARCLKNAATTNSEAYAAVQIWRVRSW